MGSGYLQALLIGELVYLLRSQLGNDYKVLTNGLGLQFSKNAWRAADIAVYSRYSSKYRTNYSQSLNTEFWIFARSAPIFCHLYNRINQERARFSGIIPVIISTIFMIGLNFAHKLLIYRF